MCPLKDEALRRKEAPWGSQVQAGKERRRFELSWRHFVLPSSTKNSLCSKTNAQISADYSLPFWNGPNPYSHVQCMCFCGVLITPSSYLLIVVIV